MAKENGIRESAVADALRRLKEEEVDLVAKLKPVQEAIAALEKIVDKSVKKAKPSKENNADGATSDLVAELAEAEA